MDVFAISLLVTIIIFVYVKELEMGKKEAPKEEKIKHAPNWDALSPEMKRDYLNAISSDWKTDLAQYKSLLSDFANLNSTDPVRAQGIIDNLRESAFEIGEDDRKENEAILKIMISKMAQEDENSKFIDKYLSKDLRGVQHIPMDYPVMQMAPASIAFLRYGVDPLQVVKGSKMNQ